MASSDLVKTARVLQGSRDPSLRAPGLVQLTVALADLQLLREARIEAIATLRVARRDDWRSRASILMATFWSWRSNRALKLSAA